MCLNVCFLSQIICVHHMCFNMKNLRAKIVKIKSPTNDEIIYDDFLFVEPKNTSPTLSNRQLNVNDDDGDDVQCLAKNVSHTTLTDHFLITITDTTTEQPNNFNNIKSRRKIYSDYIQDRHISARTHSYPTLLRIIVIIRKKANLVQNKGTKCNKRLSVCVCEHSTHNIERNQQQHKTQSHTCMHAHICGHQRKRVAKRPTTDK